MHDKINNTNFTKWFQYSIVILAKKSRRGEKEEDEKG